MMKEPTHGYKIIKSIRKKFGVYFGRSTIYPLLNSLEEKGRVQSRWDLNNERPKKMYSLTNEGIKLLNVTENSFVQIFRKITTIENNNLTLTNSLSHNKEVTL